MSLNVLVVDDSSDMRKVIIRTLNLIGVPIGEVFKQKLAGKARSARRVLDWVDMLFIDMNMPVMNGMEMLTYIRSNPETRDLPVLIISTENNPQRIHQINENRSGFIHKPFTPEALGEKIIELTGIPTA